MELLEYLETAVKNNASDIFFVTGTPVSMKKDGHLAPIGTDPVKPDEAERLIRSIYEQARHGMETLLETGDDDFSFAAAGLARFRVNVYRQRGTMAAVIRVVRFDIPDWREFGIPESVIRLADKKHGMIIVTGTAGSGKSTTEACIIEEINQNRDCHIITLEDPIEFLHRNKKSIVSQREIAIDTRDTVSALRACLRQAPDVIQLGEMRDLETIRTAMTAAETGHMILATLHTRGAVNTIDRIIDTFAPEQQNQIRIQMGSVLETVVSQMLLPDVNGGLVPAFEVMNVNNAIRSLIRDSKTHQIDNLIATGAQEGMISMDQSSLALYKAGRITAATAVQNADNPDQMKRRMN